MIEQQIISEKKILKHVGRFIRTHELIVDGDKILVALSGGKDSFSLLYILKERLKHLPINYDIIAVHVDFGFNKEQTKYIIEVCKDLNIDCRIQKTKIIPPKKEDIACFWCSWSRRKVLFNIAKELGVKKLVMGHHLDDAVETICLNMFYQSKFWCFSPREVFFNGKLEIIRPLLALTEQEIVDYAVLKKIDVKTHECPYKITDTKRVVFKQLFKDKFNNKIIKNSIYNAWLRKNT